MSNRWIAASLAALVAASSRPASATAQTAAKKPNILVMFGDDIGYWNVSAYNRGMMGYRTPNIDRIAKEGAIFTDVYAQQSCTAGRAAFITGQSPIRTGLLKVGLPGAPEGLSEKDPTIANLLKAQGYATGQFGKNHLGDRNEFIPTVHGFDEFFGNFYHLNAEEEPENPDYPKDPKFKEKFGPRGVFHCYATDAASTLPDDARFGKWGKQRCEDTGPLTKKRMETVDEEVLAAHASSSSTRSTRRASPGSSGSTPPACTSSPTSSRSRRARRASGIAPDGMVEHDGHIGQLLKKLDDLGIAENTIVIWTTDNGAEVMSWPDGGTTPFRGEKNTNWEGGYRVPLVVRWPGVIKPGTEINEIVSHEDWLPTLLAAAGPAEREGVAADRPDGGRGDLQGPPRRVQPDAVLQGRDQGVAAQGVRLLDRRRRPRRPALRAVEDGLPRAARGWASRSGRTRWWSCASPSCSPCAPIRSSAPTARAWTTGSWRLDRAFLLGPAQGYVARWIQSFKDFPPRQKPGSFNLSHVMAKLTKPRSRSSGATTAEWRRGSWPRRAVIELLLDCRAPDVATLPTSSAARPSALRSQSRARPVRAAAAALAVRSPARRRSCSRRSGSSSSAAWWGSRCTRSAVALERVLRGPGPGGHGLRPPGRPNSRARSGSTRWLEAGAAMLGFASTLALSRSAPLFVALQDAVGPLAWLLPFALVGLPAFLMGGTLPALLRALRPSDDAVPAGDGSPLRREHRRRRPGHARDAIPPRARARHHRSRRCSRAFSALPSPRPPSPSTGARHPPRDVRPRRAQRRCRPTPGSPSPSTPSPAGSRSATRSSGPSCSCRS